MIQVVLEAIELFTLKYMLGIFPAMSSGEFLCLFFHWIYSLSYLTVLIFPGKSNKIS